MGIEKEVYLASGWFSPEWLEELESLKSVLDSNGISYFSPKDENLCNCLRKPIVYYCAGLPDGAQFNLMLAASGVKVCRSLNELDEYLKRSKAEGGLIRERYIGKIE